MYVDCLFLELREKKLHKATRWAQLQKKTKILVAKVSVVKVTENSVVAVSHEAYCVANKVDC